MNSGPNAKSKNGLAFLKQDYGQKIFLTQIWKRYIQPIITLIVVYFSVQFLVSLLNHKGTQNLFTIVILSMTIILSFVYLLGALLRKFKKKVYATLSDKVKFNLKIIGKIFGYLSGIVFGVVLYILWEKDALLASFFIILFLVNKIIDIVNEEKSKLVP